MAWMADGHRGDGTGRMHIEREARKLADAGKFEEVEEWLDRFLEFASIGLEPRAVLNGCSSQEFRRMRRSRRAVRYWGSDEPLDGNHGYSRVRGRRDRTACRGSDSAMCSRIGRISRRDSMRAGKPPSIPRRFATCGRHARKTLNEANSFLILVSALFLFAAEPPETEKQQQWPVAGGGPEGMRYSPLDQINRRTFSSFNRPGGSIPATNTKARNCNAIRSS